MDLIQTVTVGSGGSASINFASIPQTFTDLVVVTSLRTTRSAIAEQVYISFNGSSASFTNRALYGNGSSATSFNANRDVVNAPSANATANTFSNGTIYLPNYTSSSNKAFSSDDVTEHNGTEAYQFIIALLWANTAAITSLTLTPGAGGSFVQHSSASLYGILKGSDGTTTVS
jgi:hypothetical protein